MAAKQDLYDRLNEAGMTTDYAVDDRWTALVNLTGQGNWINTTSMQPGETLGVMYTALGLLSEAGEVAGEVKKIVRNDNNQVTLERRNRIIDELGDVFWYLYAMMNELGITEGRIWTNTMTKLTTRLDEDKIKER